MELPLEHLVRQFLAVHQLEPGTATTPSLKAVTQSVSTTHPQIYIGQQALTQRSVMNPFSFLDAKINHDHFFAPSNRPNVCPNHDKFR